MLVAAAFVVLGVVVVCAIAGGAIAPHDPSAQNLLETLTGPSWSHPFGTDDLGRDVFSRTIAGARTAVVGPLIIALGAMIIGNLFGLWAGYRGGRVDSAIMRVAEFVFALPALLVAIVVVGVLGGGYFRAVGAARRALLPARRAARPRRRRSSSADGRTSRPRRRSGSPTGGSCSATSGRTSSPVAIANATLAFAYALVSLAALSFLGIGVGPGTADWGRMLSDSRTLLFENPATALAPGLALVLTAAAVNVIGDWLFERVSRSRAGCDERAPRPSSSCGSSRTSAAARARSSRTSTSRSAAGETVGIVGESGSGKSLTARAILGLLPPGVTASGSVRFGAQELLGRGERVLRRVRGTQISLLFQDPYTLLNPLMRVGRQITETLADRPAARRRARLAEVGITDPRSSAGIRSSSRAGCASGSGSRRRSRATRRC